MPQQTVAILDYGMGNLHSVKKACQHVAPNDHIKITSCATTLDNADKLIFPGVGAFESCITGLANNQLVTPLQQALKEKPVLGICIGMQALMQSSEENPNSQGLGYFQGNIQKLPLQANIKIPHMGWNSVKTSYSDHPLWHRIPNGSYFYFVHSYAYLDSGHPQSIGTCTHGSQFCSSLASESVFAVQFHPEKSHTNGLQLLKNFLKF